MAAEAKTETKAVEPMVTVEFQGDVYAGREPIKRARKGQRFDVPESMAHKLMDDFPEEWVVIGKSKEKASNPVSTPSGKVSEATPKIPEAAEPFKPKEKERKLPELATPGVKKESKKTKTVQPTPATEAKPEMPMPAAPTIKKEGNKITRKKTAEQK